MTLLLLPVEKVTRARSRAAAVQKGGQDANERQRKPLHHEPKTIPHRLQNANLRTGCLIHCIPGQKSREKR